MTLNDTVYCDRSCLTRSVPVASLDGDHRTKYHLLPCGKKPTESKATTMTPTPKLQRQRERFLRGFKRIGLNTTPGDAAFLRFIVESSKATRGLEIGTATGHGAMLMGLAFERNKGHLTAIEIDADMVEAARANLAKMQLEKVVTVIEGDALAVIPTLKGRFDFVFIDAVKEELFKYSRRSSRS